MQILSPTRLLPETTPQIKLSGATWPQLQNVIPKELLALRQNVEIKFNALPSTLSLRRTEGKKGQEILIQERPLSDYPTGDKLTHCLGCQGHKKKTQRICTMCHKGAGSFVVQLQCPICQQQFSIMSSRLTQRLYSKPQTICCSHSCSGQKKTKLTKTSCRHCSKLFQPQNHLSQCCSRKCADAMHANKMQGSGNTNYRHGCRAGQWKKLRLTILTRDSSLCVGCKTTEQKQLLNNGQLRTNLCVHHIDHNPSNNTPQNLITLCRQCHVAHHQVTDKAGRPSPFPELSTLAKERSLSMI